MTSSYKDIMADRSARLPPKSAAQQEVFEKAYDIALQVIDLREKHGLTQAQLAARCGAGLHARGPGSRACSPASATSQQRPWVNSPLLWACG